MSAEHILIVAGEASGDLHAAPVIAELKKLRPDLQFFGSGGDLMRQQGVELLAELDDLAVMGFSSVPRVLPRLSRLKREIIRRVQRDNVKLAILVDYPGFNLELAGSLRKLDNPPKILEYVAPQVWAWRKGRIKKIRRLVDKLAVVFPFEEKLFLDGGVNAEFVGHPLVEELIEYMDTGTVKPSERKNQIALLPGSRRAELQRHLATMVKASELIRTAEPTVRFAVGKASNLKTADYEPMLAGCSFISLEEDSRKLLTQSRAAIVCSGTATLEAALLDCPQVVVYKTSPINYQIIKHLITLDTVGLVNIVAGEKIVPELIQQDFTPETAAEAILNFLTNQELSTKTRAAYATVRQNLDAPGASARVAQIALKML